MRKITLYLTLFFIHIGVLSAQQLTNIEKKLANQVVEEMPYALAQLKQAVNTNSGTMNFAGVKAVGMQFKREFDLLGFTTKWHDGSEFNRAGHLSASYITNDENTKLLLIGHLDTVFTKNDDFQTYQEVSQGFVAGPGITDMKGGDVIILTALKAMKAQGLLDNLNIKVVMTGDEEKSGRPLSLSKKLLIDSGKWADIALGFEDGDSNIKTAVIARRGASSWWLGVKAKSAHSSQVFREDIGFGAIYEMARILNEFRIQLSQEQSLTFNPGNLMGGTKVNFDHKKSQGQVFGKDNVIAKEAMANGDIRALSPEQEKNTRKVMKQIITENLAHTNPEIEFYDGYPPMPPTEANRKLLTMYSKVSESLGYGEVIAVDPRKAGAADISFVAEYVDMALDGLGLMGTGGHTKDEVADMSSLKKNTQKAALLMYRLGQNQ